MTQPQKNTALVIAIVAGLVSLPLAWMTIHGARMEGGLGDMFNSALGEMTITLTGLNGHVTLFFQTPLWFIIGIAIASSVLQLMGSSEMFAIPRIVEWMTAIVAVVWIGLTIVLALSSGKATLGVGALVGFAAAVIPLLCLTFPSTDQQRPQSDESKAQESLS